MVRMNPLNEMDGEAAAAAAAEGGGGGDESTSSYKRARSSLDYKGDPTSDTIIAKEKTTNQQTFDVDPRGGSSAPQQQRQAQADVESMFAGMSPEQIINHLTENPELARQLGFDPSTLANAQQAKSSSSTGSSTSRKAHRTELLKSEGFPFVQWAIVLVVLGLGLYRLYMAVKPPTTAGKQKVKRKSGKVPAAVKATDDIALSKVLAELEESGDEDFKGGWGKSSGVKKAKKKPPSKAKPKLQPPQGKATERALVGDSDSEEESPAPVPARKSKSSKNASVATPVATPQEVGGGEWQTVRGGKPSAATTNGAGKQKIISFANDASKGEGLNGDSAPLPATAPDGSAADAKKKAKKKKKKAGSESGGAPVFSEEHYGNNENDAGTDDDEALAIRLQEEENNLSAYEEDDVWAEVTNKKKKAIKE